MINDINEFKGQTLAHRHARRVLRAYITSTLTLKTRPKNP